MITEPDGKHQRLEESALLISNDCKRCETLPQGPEGCTVDKCFIESLLRGRGLLLTVPCIVRTQVTVMRL